MYYYWGNYETVAEKSSIRTDWRYTETAKSPREHDPQNKPKRSSGFSIRGSRGLSLAVVRICERMRLPW